MKIKDRVLRLHTTGFVDVSRFCNLSLCVLDITMIYYTRYNQVHSCNDMKKIRYSKEFLRKKSRTSIHIKVNGFITK